jgi:hypothetical protein
MKKINIFQVMTFLLFLVLLLNCQTGTHQTQKEPIYWEEFNESKKEEILELSSTNELVRRYYKGSYKVSDDDTITILLDTLVNIRGEQAALYFFLFNNICDKADGAVAELLGGFCQDIILKSPVYVFSYLSDNELLLKKYAMHLGYELYFYEEGTSSLRYSYSEFKKLMEEELKEEKHLKEALNMFFAEIEKTMQKMD